MIAITSTEHARIIIDLCLNVVSGIISGYPGESSHDAIRAATDFLFAELEKSEARWADSQEEVDELTERAEAAEVEKSEARDELDSVKEELKEAEEKLGKAEKELDRIEYLLDDYRRRKS